METFVRNESLWPSVGDPAAVAIIILEHYYYTVLEGLSSVCDRRVESIFIEIALGYDREACPTSINPFTKS